MTGSLPVFVPHAGCPHQCSFCNQRTISGAGTVPGPEETAEFCRRSLEYLPEKLESCEIAFFGGSFTAIPRRQMTGLLEAVQPFRTHPKVKGLRCSTRPDAISREILELLKRYGMTAVELGAQSMDDDVLRRNGRGHTAAQTAEAAALIREAGLELGLQMMTGLPGSSYEKDWETARRLAALSPDTMRIYPTVVLRGTELERWMQEGSYHPPGVAETVPLCAELLDFLEPKGIRVIRLGLHASEEVQGEAVGGCYHPAFGELCASERWFRRISSELEQLGGKRFLLSASGRLSSQIAGQHRRNRERWQEQGFELQWKIVPEQQEPYRLERL